LLNGIRAKRLLVLVDSCFSAATVISYPRGKNFKSRKVKNPFDSFKGEGRVVITASEGKQMAAELPQLGHGAFTYFLLEGLKGKADSNFDNVVELWEIWQYLDKKVTDAVHNAGGDQRPTISSVHLTHGFPLTTYPLDAPQVAAPLPGKTDHSAGKTPDPGWVTINREAGRPLYMSSTEITNRQYLDFVTANPKWRKDRIPIHYQDGDYLRHWPDPETYPKGLEDHPVTYVSWFAAKAFAEWAGAHLPSESEWTTAASGGKGSVSQTGVSLTRLYPWGNTWNPALCNHRSGADTGTAAVHAFERGGSLWPDGTIYNLSGNVWEWCSDWVFEYTTPSGTRGIVVVPIGANKKPEINRLIKGGSFLADRLGCMIGSRVWADPRLCAEDGGFRVVKD
jgi:formylglycine-generating enzyme required for sulfatase activity